MVAKCNPVKFEDFKMLECKSLIIYVLPVTNLTYPRYPIFTLLKN